MAYEDGLSVQDEESFRKFRPTYPATLFNYRRQTNCPHQAPREGPRPVSPAEGSLIPDAPVDLVIVAQARYWFELPRFFWN